MTRRGDALLVSIGLASVVATGVFSYLIVTRPDPIPSLTGDVSHLTCRWSRSAGVASMTATITNSADMTRDYELRVDFVAPDEVRVGSGDLIASAVEPGQVVEVRGLGSFTPGREIDHCTIVPRG